MRIDYRKVFFCRPIERGNLSPVGHDLYETDDTNGKRKCVCVCKSSESSSGQLVQFNRFKNIKKRGTSKTISVACINQNEFEISNGRE